LNKNINDEINDTDIDAKTAFVNFANEKFQALKPNEKLMWESFNQGRSFFPYFNCAQYFFNLSK